MVSWQQSRTITLTEFRAKCLAVFDNVKETGRPVRVTKRGKPYIIVNPLTPEDIAWVESGAPDEW
jgi:prevent-host-death family protein